MKARISLLLALLALPTMAVKAQQSVSLETLIAALQFRADMAELVGGNQESPDSALQRLRAAGTASGFAAGRDVDFSYAALDIGQRLIALHRPDAAEIFFGAAEGGFQQAANRAQAREKAEYLGKLAEIRGNFLNKVDQARLDIDEALRLQPGDIILEQLRRVLARGHSEQFKETKKN